MQNLAIIFALPMEAASFLRHLAVPPCNVRSYPIIVRSGHLTARIAISGCGGERSALCAAETLAEHPDALIVAGFAGALDDSLDSGDIIIAQSVLEVPGPPSSYGPDASLLNAAVRTAEDSRTHCITGRLLTASETLHSSAEKAEKAELYRCCAVDMESAPAAALAEKAGIPFIAVRCIVDRFCDAVPEPIAAAMDRDSVVSLRRLFIALITRPRYIRDLLRLRAQSQAASRNLTEFITAFVDKLGLVAVTHE